VLPSTQKIFVHPWYIQQQKLESTTTSESQSRLKQSREEIGQKYIDENEVAWAAGLFEGEGCLYFDKRYDRWYMKVNMTDKDVVDHFASIYQFKTHAKKVKEGYKPQWAASCGRRHLLFKVICDFYPYLASRRRAKCDEFLKWYAEKTNATFD